MMATMPILLSVVFVVRNLSNEIQSILLEASEQISQQVSDYELIIIDNASEDDGLATLRGLTGENGLPNLQIFALTKEVDPDTAAWVGLENSLGDYVAVIDPITDDIGFLNKMLSSAARGADVVFATNQERPVESFAYQTAYYVFNHLYRWFNDIHLGEEAPRYRLIARKVINFLIQYPNPAITYRHLPATGGFMRINLKYSAAPKISKKKRLRESVERGMGLMVSTTNVPLRIVTFLSFFGAGANVMYSLYIVAIGLLKVDVAPGWISLSLQQSGMFFLLSLVLLVLAEYLLQFASLTTVTPRYHVAQEFTSARMTRHEKLNVEEKSSTTLARGAFTSIGEMDDA
jgi:glycosyltransferase involved in cell wall biosynthesis